MFHFWCTGLKFGPNSASSLKFWRQNSNLSIRERIILQREKKSANSDFMLYVQTACTIALLKVETISDCRERKLCQKSTSSLSKIISSFINCIPLVRTTALFYKKRVHGILLLFIEKFQNWKVNASEWSEHIGVYVYLGHQRLRPFCLLHDITQNREVKYILKENSYLHTIS